MAEVHRTWQLRRGGGNLPSDSRIKDIGCWTVRKKSLTWSREGCWWIWVGMGHVWDPCVGEARANLCHRQSDAQTPILKRSRIGRLRDRRVAWVVISARTTPKILTSEYVQTALFLHHSGLINYWLAQWWYRWSFNTHWILKFLFLTTVWLTNQSMRTKWDKSGQINQWYIFGTHSIDLSSDWLSAHIAQFICLIGSKINKTFVDPKIKQKDKWEIG